MSPVLPPNAALLLDLDGTLIDLAATPGAVVVPPDLPEILRRLRAVLGDAVAVVTGRPIAQVDALLGAAPFAVAGEHGAAIRHRPDGDIERLALPAVPGTWLLAAEAAVAAEPGALLEHKQSGFVLHYRLAPEAGPILRAVADGCVRESPGFKVMEAKMAWEVKPMGTDKGKAVASLMARPPFLGRVPCYVGDDVTDEDGIRAAKAIGGDGWLVGDFFGTPEAVRRWLDRISAARPPAGGRS